jgi:hypothetical protein
MPVSKIPIDATADYFDDKPIDGSAADRLGHRAVAAEILGLALSRKANTLGIFGEWGTGKSSVIALLRESLAKHKVTPVVFDAWQHSAEPLRRQLLVAIAKVVDPASVAELKSKLYESRQEPTAPSVLAVGRLLLLLSIVFIAAVVLLSAAGVLIAGKWDWSLFGVSVAQTVTPALAPTVLLAFAITVVAKLYEKLPWGTVLRPPIVDERLDEELAQLLKTAAKQAKFRPLVLIVDELDRCPSHRVAETLELTRQFLSPSGCVTVISADRDYLSRAWYAATGIDGVERPGDFAEYLDKVFDRQVSLPPLHPTKLSSYALDLTSGHGGIWADGVDVEALIGVLIPSSVKTPRRAKALLNHFVTQYHIARGRFTTQVEAARLETRVLQFAKLCTVKAEFPQFFEQIRQTQRAASLAEDVLALAQFTEADREESGHYPGLTVFLDRLVLAQVNLRRGIEESLPAEREMQALVRYLSRTSGVATGSHDLLFLETAIDSFSLEPSLAEELYSFALDDQADTILSAVGDDPRVIGDAVRYIASRLKEAIGLERANACKTCFLLSASPKVPIHLSSARALLDQVDRTRREQRLTPYTAPGRIRMASLANSTAAAIGVLGEPEVRGENDARLDAEVIIASMAQDAQPSLAEAALEYFLLTDVGALAYVAEEDAVQAARLVNLLLDHGAAEDRLRRGHILSTNGVEEPSAAAIDEYGLLARLADDSRMWDLGRIAVALGHRAYAESWLGQYSDRAMIGPNDGEIVAGMLLLLPRSKWDEAQPIIKRGTPTPAAFISLLSVLTNQQDDHVEDRLWTAMLTATGFDASAEGMESLGSTLPHDWADEGTSRVGTSRLIDLCKRLPCAATVGLVIAALSAAVVAATSADDASWSTTESALGDAELIVILGLDGVKAILNNVDGTESLETSTKRRSTVRAYAILGHRPPLSEIELAELAVSESTQDTATLRQFLAVKPTARDLVVIAEALREADESGLGVFSDAFNSALGLLSSADAAAVYANLLTNKWPRRDEMSLFRANPASTDRVLLLATKQYADGRNGPTRRYAIQVIETLAPLTREAASKVTRAHARRIRSGGLDDLRTACANVALTNGASATSREDLRKALAGALKRRPCASDAQMIEHALRVIA